MKPRVIKVLKPADFYGYDYNDPSKIMGKGTWRLVVLSTGDRVWQPIKREK